MLLGLGVVMLFPRITLCSLDTTTTAERLEKVQKVSALLDSLLDGYNKDIRPEGNGATTVTIDISVRSLGPISESDMTYSLDCYFRQSWQDERLSFINDSHSTTLALGMSMLDRIWKPDTYFLNGLNSQLHTLTQPNKFVRLSNTGHVHFSSRLTIVAKCPMFLEGYPLDSQRCPLTIGSFSYRENEMKFFWKGVGIYEAMRLSQFALSHIEIFNRTLQKPTGNYSLLEAHFQLRRHAGYFLINFYGPCTLIVILSWVAFWINREATADRIALGVTSMLTMTYLALDSRTDIPRVPYATALDVYLIMCFSCVFASVLEFAFVHAHTKYGTGDPELHSLEKERLDEKRKALEWRHKHTGHIYITPGTLKLRHNYHKSLLGLMNNYFNPTPLVYSSNPLDADPLAKRVYQRWVAQGQKRDKSNTECNSVSQIDRLSRGVFPLIFCVTSSFYWCYYFN